MARRLRKQPTPGRARENLPEGWSWYCNGRLRGCGLLRERQWVYAWDDSRSIYLLDLQGDLIAHRRIPKEIMDVSADEIGGYVVAVGRTGDIWWLDRELEPQLEIRVPFDPLSVAVDPFGQYAVISSQDGKNIICTRAGRKTAEFHTTRPLKHLRFVPSTGLIIAAAEHGLVTCLDYRGQVLWQNALWSNVGSLAVDGGGNVILLGCYGHGLIRFSASGNREGIYRYDYSPSQVVVDFEGSRIIAASLEQYVTELTYEGVLKANKYLEDKPVALGLDALGRYGVIGMDNGEIRFVTFPDFFSAGGAPTRTGTSTQEIRVKGLKPPEPAWEVRAAANAEEVASAVMEPLADGRRLALFTRRQTLRVFDDQGEKQFESAGVTGIGRFLRIAPKWMVAGTDQSLIAYDPELNQSTPCFLPLTEVSHLQLYDALGDALLIQSREFASRLQFPEHEVWRKQIEWKVEAAAVMGDGFAAMTLDDGNMLVVDGQEKTIGNFRPKPKEALMVLALGKTWITTGRQAKVLRGHDIDGRLLWTLPLPWTPWSSRTLGEFVVITNADGHSLLVREDGTVAADSQDSRENARYFLMRNGEVGRAFCVGESVIINSFEGRLLWRYTADRPLGPFVASKFGVWVFVGRMLTFFPFEQRNGADGV